MTWAKVLMSNLTSPGTMVIFDALKNLHLQSWVHNLTKNEIFIYRGVEQLVARRAHNPKVVGSSPAPATKHKKPGPFGRVFYV